MDTRSTRSRAVAAVVASMALLGSGAAITATPAQSAAPAADCAEAFPVSDLTDGQAVTGLTVAKGTEPIGFTGSYLGKVNGGIGAGLDMLMFEMDFEDSRLDEVGIWQGMSGSPVYAEDGRLIGAVAYGLSFGPSLVAGVTPFEDMDDYLGGEPPATIEVAPGQARTIAAESDVSARQADQGFRQLPMPMTISGLREGRLAQMKRKGPKSLSLAGVRAGSGTSSEAAAAEETLVAGGNLGAALSYGDITTGGVGTVTSVCDDRLVGFGHPMTFGGNTTLGLMPAEAVYVHGDPAGPGFKLANMGAPAGTITDDHLTGISGDLGPDALPPETDISSTVTYGDRNRTGTSSSLSPDYHANVTFSQILANHDRVVDAIQGGSEVASYTISGSTDAGPFEIAFGDRYTSDYDISFEAIFGIADTMFALSQIEGVDVDTVDATADVTDSTDVARLGQMQQRRGGGWVPITRRQPAVVKPGGTLTVRAQLKSPSGTEWLTEQVKVARKARGEGRLMMTGGSWTWNDGLYRADTLAEVKKAVASDVRNDQVETRLMFWSRRSETGRTVVSDPQELVVVGSRGAPVVVRR